VTVTFVLFQPLALAGTLRVAVSVGAVLSMLIPASVTETELPARSVATSVALRLTPSAVSAIGDVTAPMPDRASAALNVTVTSVLYQPFALGGPLRAAVSVGAVLS